MKTKSGPKTIDQKLREADEVLAKCRQQRIDPVKVLQRELNRKEQRKR